MAVWASPGAVPIKIPVELDPSSLVQSSNGADFAPKAGRAVQHASLQRSALAWGGGGTTSGSGGLLSENLESRPSLLQSAQEMQLGDDLLYAAGLVMGPVTSA